MLPAVKPGGRPRKHALGNIMDALRYVLRGGYSWRALPHEYPPRPTVYGYFQAWQRDGTWERLNDELRDLVWQRAGWSAAASGHPGQSIGQNDGKSNGLACQAVRDIAVCCHGVR
jgi:transposase